MRFLLIPVGHAAPTVAGYLAATHDHGPFTSEECKQLVAVAVHFTLTSRLLLRYVRLLTRRPCSN